MVEFEHGADWWIHERYTGLLTFAFPPEWNAYPGHYVSEIPWSGQARIILRKEDLYLVEAEGYERELFQLSERNFGYRRNRASMALQERVRFDAVIDDQARCLNLAGLTSVSGLHSLISHLCLPIWVNYQPYDYGEPGLFGLMNSYSGKRETIFMFVQW